MGKISNSTDVKIDFLKKIIKKPNLTILFTLQKQKTAKWGDFSLYPRDLHKGIRELLNLGLIRVIIVHDTPTGSKAYELTPLGKKIVQHIEEMEKEFQAYHSPLPKRSQ
jgi:DNA-binding HxlR family transcriptional regulator